jgi:hypothetical protein
MPAVGGTRAARLFRGSAGASIADRRRMPHNQTDLWQDVTE